MEIMRQEWVVFSLHSSLLLALCHFHLFFFSLILKRIFCFLLFSILLLHLLDLALLFSNPIFISISCFYLSHLIISLLDIFPRQLEFDGSGKCFESNYPSSYIKTKPFKSHTFLHFSCSIFASNIFFPKS